MIIAGTGHRPKKLGGYSDTAFQVLVDFAEEALKILKPDRVISGMALGWDQAMAQAAVNLKIPYIAAVPFRDYEAKWPMHARSKYYKLLTYAEKQIMVSQGGYHPSKLFARNEWMIDNCTHVLAMYDISERKSGTGHCVAYALKKGKRVINIYKYWKGNDLAAMREYLASEFNSQSVDLPVPTI